MHDSELPEKVSFLLGVPFFFFLLDNEAEGGVTFCLCHVKLKTNVIITFTDGIKQCENANLEENHRVNFFVLNSILAISAIIRSLQTLPAITRAARND